MEFTEVEKENLRKLRGVASYIRRQIKNAAAVAPRIAPAAVLPAAPLHRMPRQRAHRAAPRAASKATAPPDSDEPAPAPSGPNYLFRKLKNQNRGGKNA